MNLRNIPIEVISQFNVMGDIIPLKFRMESIDHVWMIARINEILYVTENQFAGIKTLDYGCKVVLEEREQCIELRYHVDQHKWTIRKDLY